VVSNEDPKDFQPGYQSADGKHRPNFENSEEYYFRRESQRAAIAI
jgi:hypothetical protein